MQSNCCVVELIILRLLGTVNSSQNALSAAAVMQAGWCLAHSLRYWYDPHSVHAVLPYLQTT